MRFTPSRRSPPPITGGADWLEKPCAEHNIAHAPGTVDIGGRVETRNEVMEMVNRVLYEFELVGYPQPFKNRVHTFCQNPGGFVSQETYDNKLAVVNAHSYKDLKRDDTTLPDAVAGDITAAMPCQAMTNIISFF